LDDLTVNAVEAARIETAHPELLATAAPRAAGGCAFLDEEGACRVYADRPSVCRSQGLPLRVFFENEEDEIEEHRDICPLNLEGGPPLEELDDSEFWLVGPFDLRLSAINDAFEDVAGDSLDEGDHRVPLRSLFSRKR
jgi:hypothetical protein